MNVTAEQWAQAEAERQRQADMVRRLFNEVRRLGTEQNNNLQEIQRLRAEQLLTVPPVEPSEGADVCWSFSVSVDQDLSVIVAETINDDDVKQRLVPNVFTRA